jgi:membrane protease YdiL (CAAX protease family)
MQKAMWLVPGLSTVILLFVGTVVLFSLMVVLNGFSGTSGGIMLASFLVLLVATLFFAAWASRRSLQALVSRTNWPLWISSLLIIMATVVIASGILLLDLFVVIAVGHGVLGMR